MNDGVRRTLRLMDAQAKRRWVVLALAAFAVSGLEVASAVLVYAVMSLIDSPAVNPQLPAVGGIEGLLPEVPANQRLLIFVGAVGVFFVVRTIAMVLQTYLQARFVQAEGVKLSTRLLRGYTALPYVVHLRRDSAELIRNTMGSVSEVVTHAFAPAIAIAADALMVLSLLAVLVAASWQATIASLVLIVALVLVILRLVHPKLVGIGEVAQRVYRETIKALQHTFEGLREIRVLGKEGFFAASFERSWAEHARAQYLRAVLVELPRMILETVLMLAILAFLAVTVLTQDSPTEALAVLGLFGYVTLRVIPAVNRLIANVNAFKYGTAAVRIVADDIELVERAADARRAAQDDGSDLPFRDALRLEDVWFRYTPDGPWVLQGVDFDFPQGESIGIVGTTGGGKSTIADVILGLLEPDRGQVSVDGIDLATNLRSWQAKLGIVPQSVFLVDDTIANNIALGLESDEIDESRLWEVARVAQLTELLEELPKGFDTLVGERGVRLSGGQRQRIAIARALYRDPQVIVFDEGTSALDNATEAALLRAIESSRGDRTLIQVAHRLTTVRQCDRVMVVEAGRIVSTGNYESLSRDDRFFQDLAR